MTGSLFKKNRAFYVSVACVVADGVLDGANFGLIYLVMSEVFSGSFRIEALLWLSAGLVCLFAVRFAIYSYGYVQGQVGGASVSRAVRLALGDKLRRIPLARFTERTSGDYLNALSVNVNDYEQVLTHKTGSIVKGIVLGAMLTCFVTWLYAPAGAVVFAMFAMLAPGLAVSWRQVRTFGVRKSAVQAANASAVVEHVRGMQTLRAYGFGGVRNKAIVESMREYSDISYRYEAAVTPPGAVVFAIVGMGAPALYVLCGNAWLSGALDVVSMLMICMLPLFTVKLITALFVDLTAYKNLMISKGRMEAVAREAEEAGSVGDMPVQGYGISLASVGFAYGGACTDACDGPDASAGKGRGAPVFHSLSLECGDGRLTALVGESGCGKSTALSLIAQYYRPDSGTVAIGGVDTAGYAPESVLRNIAIVDQEVFLFDDTVMDNVRYARPSATNEDVRRACYLANADSFIRAMPQGYDTRIGENGGKLSGGERQRLSIARAILKDAPIVLLDEATASLDIENELAVKEAIGNLLAQRRTVVMVAHTLPVIRSADCICVIGDGRVLESGTHDQLMALGGRYAAMWAADRKLA